MLQRKKVSFSGFLIIAGVILGLVIDTSLAGNDNLFKNIVRLDNVLQNIHKNYVIEIPADELVEAGAEGITDILDPHTNYMPPKKSEELRIHTEGEFGGLGITISIRDKVLTVISPLSGTPASRAGLRAGDKIVKIEDEDTKGITVSEAVEKLRGEPGSEVNISVRRQGVSEVMEYNITRQIIEIHTVPFAGILQDNIGYVSITGFSKKADQETGDALKKLLDEGAEGIILDFRGNPGGLLSQAIKIAEKVLGDRKLVVYSRGRMRGQDREFHASSKPIVPDDIPVAVLVNASSASASEIVAGAVQDWDRGIVLGDTTFGKGSVQSVLPLGDDYELKMTTAFYYTPSGRCINKKINAVKFHEEEEENGKGADSAGTENDTIQADQAESEEDESDSPVVTGLGDTAEIYHTDKGRVVKGGGGIIPDTVVESETIRPALRSLYIKDFFFKFANKAYPNLKERKNVIDTSFKVSEALMDDFYAFLDSVEFEFKTILDDRFHKLKIAAGLVDTSEDSTAAEYEKHEWSGEEQEKFKELTTAMKRLMDNERKAVLEETEGLIKDAIKHALLVREYGEDNEMVVRESLSEDRQVEAAIALLKNKELYNKLLTPVESGKSK